MIECDDCGVVSERLQRVYCGSELCASCSLAHLSSCEDCSEGNADAIGREDTYLDEDDREDPELEADEEGEDHDDE